MSHTWKPVARGFECFVDLPDPREGHEPMRFSVSIPAETSMLKDPWLTVVDFYGRASMPLPDHLRLCEWTEEEDHEVPADVRHAAGMLGGIVPGNVLTDVDYQHLSTIRKWIYEMEFAS